MQRITVSRNDDIYEAFADVAQAADGTLVCTYRESMCHSSRPWSKVILRRSHDRGLTWGPRQVVYERTRQQTAAGEGRLNCSRIAACADGALLLIVDRLNRDEYSGHAETQTSYVSSDRGRTWEGPCAVPDPPVPTVTGAHWRLNEGDYVELDDGGIVLYMREDGDRLSGCKSLSTDGGRSWSGPVRLPMMHCAGRPSAGRLRSGEIAVTYRVACGLSTSLGLYVETAAEAMRGFESGSREGPAETRFAVLDNDRALSPDSGYSGWVQLPEGDLYVVNYITDDAPRAYIRGYRVGREDWYLYPEGAIAHNPPMDREGRYYETGQELARQQQAWVDRQDWSRTVPTQK